MARQPHASDTPRLVTGMPRKRLADGSILAGLLAVAAILIFSGLGDRQLWQDEAETALLAKSILKTGRPVAFDGINLISQEVGREVGPDGVWRWSPWTQFYLAAAGMKLWGVTTVAARLPFACLGFLCVPMVFVLAREFSGSALVARLSALYLTSSVPFLLHVRQARWYAAAYLVFAVHLWFLINLEKRRKTAMAGLIASGIALFYVNYLVAIAALAASCFASPLLRSARRSLVDVALAYLAIALGCIPGVRYFQVLAKSGNTDMAMVWSHVRAYACSYVTFLLPLTMLLILGALLTRRHAEVSWLKEPGKRRILFLMGISAIFILALSMGPLVFFRYLTVLLPVTCILMSLGTAWIWQRRKFLGIACAVVLAGTDVLNMLPLGYFKVPGTMQADRSPLSGPVASPITSLIYELSHPSREPIAAVTKYLLENARHDDVVLTTYDDLPLQFYTGLKVIGGLQGNYRVNNPDWIIVHPYINSVEPGKDLDVRRFIARQIDLRLYEPVHLPAYGSSLGNDPDPDVHMFKIPESGLGWQILRRRWQAP